MADSSLQVKISADVTSLSAQVAVAKTNLTDLNATVKSLASQFVAASDDMKGSLAPQLDAAAQQAAAVKVELASLNAEMRESTHPEVTGFFGQLSESARITGESFETMHARLSVFSSAINSFSEFLVAGLALEQVGETINRVAESGEQMEKLSQETGLTTEQLSGLKVLAAETGTSFDEFTRLIDKLPSTMQQAATGTGKAAEAFAAMGIRVTGANGQLLPMGQVLDEVSAKLSSYADGTNKTALETDIFGAKIGASLLPMLNELGQIGIQGAIAQSDNLNQTWTGASAEAAEQYEQDMGRAKLAVEGITDSLVRHLLPALDAVANVMAPTLDAQISTLSERVNELGMRASVGMRQELEELKAQKAALDASMQQQSQTVGGAAQGSVQAPTISASASGADFMKDQTAALDQQNEQIEASATSIKEANAEKLQNTVQYWQGVLQAGNLTAAEELSVQTALAKAETAQKANQLSAGTSAAKSAAETQTEIAKDAAAERQQIDQSEYDAQVSVANSEIGIASSKYDTQVALWDEEVAANRMTKSQEVADEASAQAQLSKMKQDEVQMEISAQDQMYQAQLAELQNEVEVDAAGTAAKAKALDDIQVLTAQHNATLEQLNADLVQQQQADVQKVLQAHEQAAQDTQAAWQKAFQPISQAFDTSINGIIQGTETMRQAEAKAAQSIALAFIDAEAKKLTMFVASEAMILARGVATEMGLTAASAAGNVSRLASKTAADATGKAEDVALGTAQINASAMKAAAGAYSAVAGIPIVGPVLAPAAAATAYAGVMAFDVLSAAGGMVVPANVNPLTQLHENEMVLPAHIASPLQAMIQGSGNMGGGGGDSHVTNNLTMNANVADGGDFVSQVGAAFNSLVRSGALQQYPSVARWMRR